MRIVYMGTPDFSVPALEALVNAGHEVVGVVTQPDKPKGRGGKVIYTPVKEKALEYGIEVFQPVKIKEADSVEWLRDKNPELIVVAAFGQILSKEILDMPKYGCINIHASLLPKLRGAAPIQQAVIDGDKESGVTIMKMDVGLDTGDMIMKEVVVLDEKETGGSLHDKLSVIGGNLVIKAIETLKNGTFTLTPQGEDFTYAGMLHKKMGIIDFTQDAVKIERLIRGLNPWPSAYTYINGKMLKIWSADVITDTDSIIGEIDCKDRKPGEIVHVTRTHFYVLTGNGILKICELQPEGKKRMNTADYLNGVNIEVGDMLSSAIDS